MSEATLWKWFSLFIRLRDSDDNGYCQCFTCTRIAFYKKMDCGHGHGRQHKGTKYSEKNNHAQCGVCNAFEGGKREIYKVKVDKLYGAGTWDVLEMAARKPLKLSQIQIDTLGNYYRIKVKAMLKQKHIAA